MDNNLDIINVIEKNPGIKFREMMRKTGLNNGSLSYYIRKLEKSGHVKTERTPGTTRFYPPGIEREEAVLIKHLRQRISRKIITGLIQNPLLTFRNLVELAKVSNSYVSILLSKLIFDGVIDVKFEKRERRYHLKKVDLVKKTICKYCHGMPRDIISDHRKILTLVLFVLLGLSQRLVSYQTIDTILINKIPWGDCISTLCR
jgi:DNA-binding transcriptional regulator GbsR (MarR family)